jgi:hypothetical protein
MPSIVNTGNRPDYTFSTALDASSNTTDYVSCSGFNYHTFQIVHTGTFTMLKLRVEGSLDATNWFGIDPSNNPTAGADYSGNIVYAVNTPHRISFRGKYNFLRVFYEVSASTTHTTISNAIKYSGSGG